MGLSRTGCVALHYWTKIAELNDHAVLDTFIVMANHVHGLLGLVPELNVNDALEVGSLESNDATQRILTFVENDQSSGMACWSCD